LAKHVGKAGPIAHKQAGFGHLARRKARG
jgi:hypothetical protein